MAAANSWLPPSEPHVNYHNLSLSHQHKQYTLWQAIYSYFQFYRLICINRRETNIPIGCDSSFVSVKAKWDNAWIQILKDQQSEHLLDKR